MNSDEFVAKMKEHNLTLTELIELHEQWEKFNYMAKDETRKELNKTA